MQLPTDYDVRGKWTAHAKLMIDVGLDMADWIALRRRMRDDDIPEPQRCSHCWNEARKEMSKSCIYCWGTGYAGGYYPLEIVRGSVSDEIEKLIRFERGKMILSVPTATLPMVPKVRDEDLMAWILYDPKRHEIIQELWRYKIEDCNFMVWDTEKIGHEVTLVRLDARYELEMKIPFTL